MKKIHEADLERLRRISKDRVFEPFEGRKSLERLKATREKMEKGLAGLKKAGLKAGKWISKSKLAQISKSKIKGMVKGAKETSSSSRMSELIEKVESSVEDLRETTKLKYRDIEEKAMKTAVVYIEKGIETLILENSEEWIVKQASAALNRPDIHSMEDIRGLESIDRDILIAELYHYDDPSLKKVSKSFDSSINVALGAVVATNFPGTGLAVGFINMAKTIVKISNRLNVMSAAYGYQISGAEALFKVSAMILQSLEDWENNYDHVPLIPEALDILYSQSEGDTQSAFQELMSAIVKKDAYIAVPGVGMISLGKIGLDDLKIDLVVKHMVQNYFDEKELLEKLPAQQVGDALNDFQKIYSAFLKFDSFKTEREQEEKERLSDNTLKTRLKLLAGIDLALEKASRNLDALAVEIFHKIHRLPEEEKEQIINKELETIYDDLA